MKATYLKHTQKLLFATAALVILYACTTTAEEELPTQSGTPFDKTVGEQIPLDAAQRWIQRTTKDAREAGDFRLSPDQLQTALNTNSTGISLHHALDNNGIYRLLAIATAADGKISNSVWTIDTASGATISVTDAINWTSSFKTTHPSNVWSHYFGRDVYEEIYKTAGLSEVTIKPALDDAGKPQLVLLVWTGSSNGRPQSEPSAAYDKSFPCPPTCPQI